MILSDYLREVWREAKKVSWPKKQKTQDMTLLVIVVSLIVGIYIGILDFIFEKMLDLFL